jgi:hypothetical protein
MLVFLVIVGVAWIGYSTGVSSGYTDGYENGYTDAKNGVEKK